jgi:glycosyltransferase involved in cell wall biosynthesis
MPETHRIAFVSEILHAGGASIFLADLAGELNRRNLITRVFATKRDHPYKTDFEAAGVEVVLQDDRRLIWEDRIKSTLAALREFKPSVYVAVHGTAPFEIARHVPAGVFKVGMIHIDHDATHRSLARYAGCFDAMLCISSAIQAKLKNTPEFAALPLHHFHGGAKMPATVVEKRNDPGPLKILYFGRLERKQKRVHLFPEILRGLAGAGIPFQWTIVGGGSERTNLEATLKTTRPDQIVTIQGKVPAEELEQLLLSHDVYLLASEGEGFPRSLLEAMGHGLVPVVTNLASGVSEIVDGSTGRVVAVDDIAGYAREIVFLHEHRPLLRQMCLAAQQRVRTEFSIASEAGQWVALLKDRPPMLDNWPDEWDIQPPMGMEKSFFFSRTARFFKRPLKRLQARLPI